LFHGQALELFHPATVARFTFILEFAVNNYQAEDHNTFLDHETDVYFDRFEKFVECTKIVIGRLLTQYPDVAILFLDLHTAVPKRKTAQSLHVGVAQRYQISVLSYANGMMPELFRLIQAMKRVLDTSQYDLPSGNGFPIPQWLCSMSCGRNDGTIRYERMLVFV
jgi:hypothetical protein